MELRIEVSGEVPPAKGEARSMLSAAHPQRDRVVALLAAASAVMEAREPFRHEVRLCVAVTVSAPAGYRLPDATNLLGGIGDALQARATGADVGHLGSLARVACYGDDEQIDEVHYRRLVADGLGYVVVIRAADR
jgi:hypothetical protein